MFIQINDAGACPPSRLVAWRCSEANGLSSRSPRDKGMNLRVFFLTMVLLLPGCLEDLQDGSSQQGERGLFGEGVYSNITLHILHGEDVENATANHTIQIMLNHSAAPVHAENMVNHVMAGNYDRTHFHRVIDNFMIQGGDFERHDGTGGHASSWYGYCNGEAMASQANCAETSWTIPDEADNGLQHVACTISMAKTSAPDTGGSQFFLMPDDITHHDFLDGVHTVFGEITQGCEHVTTVSEVDTHANDRPVVPIMVWNATVVN